MATATREPKTGRKGSISEKIREYLKTHKDAKASAVAEMFGCSVANVHQAKRRGKGKKRGRKPGSFYAAPVDHAETAATPNELCVTFVRAAGGFSEAKKMLLTAEFFAGKKIR